MSRPEAAVHRSRDELVEAINALSAAQWVRLRKAASALSRGKPVEPKDLLQEAFRRALEGTRNCPAHIDVVRFLAGAMRSISSDELDKVGRSPVLVPIANYGEVEGAVDPPDTALDAEQRIMRNQETSQFRRILDLFEDDEVAQLILEGMMDGMEGEELRELVELDLTTYQSKRKLIRRRIDKRFPEGWRP